MKQREIKLLNNTENKVKIVVDTQQIQREDLTYLELSSQKRREKKSEGLFEGIMVDIFSRPDKRHQSTDSKTQQIPNRINTKKTLRHNMKTTENQRQRKNVQISHRKKTSLQELILDEQLD